jgi:hypothetical protein
MSLFSRCLSCGGVFLTIIAGFALANGVVEAGGPLPSPQIPTAVVTCSNCASYAALQAAAVSYFEQWNTLHPPGYPTGYYIFAQGFKGHTGTVLLVASTQYALSATFRFTWNFTTNAITPVAVSTASDAGAIASDGRIFARSARVPTIQLPSTITPQETPETITSTLDQLLEFTGSATPNLWHGLFRGTVGQVMQGTFIYNGQTYQIWSNDTVLVRFSNGWTVQVTWNPGAPTTWTINWNTLKNEKGVPIDLNGTPQSPTPTGDSGGPTLNLGTGTIPLLANFTFTPTTDTLPEGTITFEIVEPVEPGGGGGSSAAMIEIM